MCPYLPTTKDTINTQTLALCKDGVKILNYARGELVNTPPPCWTPWRRARSPVT